ncbi:MAG: amidohydrolase family protein, partial [Verrucomicrobiota bacterium]
MVKRFTLALAALLLSFCPSVFAQSNVPDLIFYGGKVVTVDEKFTVTEAIAIKQGKILAVGDNDDVLPLGKPGTKLIDLHGKMLLPGLIDSHVHPGAGMTEFDHTIPDMETIQDVLDYFAARAKVVPEGAWLELQQVFITRLKEQRYPTKAELDRVAPKHPVYFRTGPDAMLNTLALKLSGIDR